MSDSPFTILLVEDDAPTRRFMKLMLQKQDFNVVEAEDGQEGYEIVVRAANSNDTSTKIDLVLSDVMMANLDGIELCRKIKETPSLELVPVILCTALHDHNDRISALEAGADDFITKPIDEAELRLRLRNFRRVVKLQDQVNDAKLYAEELAEKRTEELRKSIETLQIAQAEASIAQLDVIHRLAAATEYKDADTGAHIHRIAQYTLQIDKLLGWFDQSETAIVSQASTMHDLGKIGIPDYILMKPGLLTSEEFEVMQSHTILGWRLLSGSNTPLLQIAAKIARSHHEKWDGSGYPDGLVGDQIPLTARMFSLVDVWDALISDRAYRRGIPQEEVFEYIMDQAGKHFDPELVSPCLRSCKEFINSGL
ncbi:response regulator, partial [Candidatus Sumerlaeota bacterium]|nr:response regulator [Candidatus Sumerlaeota bacterium]